MGKLKLKLLGVPEARLDGRVLTLRTKKALALLVYLVVERGPHSREELAELLWPKSGRSKDRMALRSALANLRRELGETEDSRGARLLVERDSLSFNATSGTEIDLETIHAAFEAARTSSATSRREPPQEGLRQELLVQLGEAADAYRGEFLQGFYLDDASEFDYWANLERERWRTEAGLVLDRLSQCLLEAGASREAVDVAERWMGHDPLSEDANERLMQALHALGDTAGALMVYEQYRSTLKQNLSAEPGPEPEALAARIEAENRQMASSRPSARSAAWLPEPPFVGRSEEFGILIAEYHSARRGSVRAVAVAGEAGIGKTRLVEQFLRWALAEGADVLKGAAFEATGGLPYGPLVDALRERVDRERAPDDLLDDVWLSELSRLLPELEERYPDLSPPTSDETAAKTRLFEAVAELVVALAERKPIVLFVDDMQWADAATLDLLRYASRRWTEEGAPVLLVMAARAETPEVRARLTEWQAGFSHDLPMRRVVLGPLTEDDTVRLLQSLAFPEREGEGEEATRLERFGRWLHDETGGQPFFLSETLSALVEQGVLVRHREAGWWGVDVGAAPGGMVPPSVREAIVGRLASLGPGASMLLAVAAVLGRPSDFEDLRRVAGMDEEEGLSALEEALASGLLREVAGDVASPLDAYTCAHDMTRDVIYTEAGGARRGVYHRRALRTLEEDEDVSAAELARHALAAGLSDEAFRHLLAAGDEAMALFAASDAVEHYESARKHFRGARGQPGGSPLKAELEHLYTNLGRAYELSGEWEKARATYDAMLTASRNERKPALECAALNRLAIFLVQRFGDAGGAKGLLREALEVAETSGDKAAVAETEWNLAQMAIHGQEPDTAVAHAEEALKHARELGLEELAARSLYTLAVSYSSASRWEEGVARAREAAALYARMGDRGAGSLAAQYLLVGSPPSEALHNQAMEAQCLATVAVAEVNRGEPGASVNAGLAALKIGRVINNEWSQALAAANLSQGLIEEGSYGEALRTVQEGVRLARKLPNPVLLLLALYAAGNAHQAILRLEEAHPMYQEALEIADAIARPWESPMVTRLCANRALAGDREAAHRYALESVGIRDAVPARLVWLDFVRYHETEALLRDGNEELAREDVKRLGERVGGNRRFRLVHLRMLAVLSRWNGKRDEAIAYLREAQVLAEQIGLPGELWQIRTDLGELHKEQGERDAAQVAFNRAAGTLRTLIEKITDEGLREGFLGAPLVRRVLEERKGAV